jgi:hypothetical protein
MGGVAPPDLRREMNGGDGSAVWGVREEDPTHAQAVEDDI